MSEDSLSKARESDAPITAAVHQRDIAGIAANQMGWHDAAMSGRTVTINRPRAEVYAFWRDFRNLARFLENVESVEPGAEGRTHWVVKGPGGASVEWDAILTQEDQDSLLAWESAPGADIRNSGMIVFRDAPPGRGTYVTAAILYEPPGGEAGKAIAKIFQKEPKVQARRDLRRFKQLMETGEISTAQPPDAAPRG